jgi:hypothetical protein
MLAKSKALTAGDAEDAGENQKTRRTARDAMRSKNRMKSLRAPGVLAAIPSLVLLRIPGVLRVECLVFWERR